MNITYELYKKNKNTNECLICNDKNADGYKRIRVYYDGDLVDDESVHLDGEGNEYFQIKNPYYQGNGGSFANRPKDAIQAIQDGYGDVFVKNDCFGTGVSFETVYRYIDRDYGSKAREQTLSAFEGVNFEYAIRFGIKGSKDGMRYVNSEYMLISSGQIDENALTFQQESEAVKYKDKILIIAQKGFEALKNTMSGPNDVAALYEWMSESPFCKGGEFDKGHIANAVFFAMLQEWQENKTDTFAFEVVQTIKN